MVEVKNLHIKYKDQHDFALNDINLKVEEGELFGLIGPDGAGKTSLFRILATLLLPSSGKANVLGLDVEKDLYAIRRKLGYMPGRFSLYQDLSVEENLQFFATLFETTVEENYDLVKDIYIQLEPFKKRKAGALSGGMKQKLALCCALIHKPELLLLDEPTTGVDTVSRKEFWDMLGKLKQTGLTILVSTPYMDEASRCDRVALIQNGKILSVDTPKGIVDSFPFALYQIKSKEMYKLHHDLIESDLLHSAHIFGEWNHVVFKNGNTMEQLVDYLSFKGHSAILWNVIEPGIEDCFIERMNLGN